MLINGHPIIAVDFDGTLNMEDVYPNCGEPNTRLISRLRMLRECGAYLVLNTCRVGVPLFDAIEWCKAHGLVFDCVNCNCQDLIDRWDGDTRKICADLYIDDKGVTPDEFCDAADAVAAHISIGKTGGKT